jgi:hypothetical protein
MNLDAVSDEEEDESDRNDQSHRAAGQFQKMRKADQKPRPPMSQLAEGPAQGRRVLIITPDPDSEHDAGDESSLAGFEPDRNAEFWEINDQIRHDVRHFQLACAFNRWRNSLMELQGNERRGMIIYNRRLLGQVLKQWGNETISRFAVHHYENTLIGNYLLKWNEKKEHINDLEAEAESYEWHRTTGKFYSLWYQRAGSFYREQDTTDMKLVAKVFRDWRFQAITAPLVRIVQEYVNERIMYEQLMTWRARTKLQIASAEFYKQNTIRKAFRAWRLTLRYEIISELHDNLLELTIIRDWLLQQRLQVATRQNDRRLQRKVFRLFLERLKERQGKLRRARRQVVVSVKRTDARRIFRWWKARMEYRAEEIRFSERRHEVTLMEKFLRIWRDHSEFIKYADEIAFDTQVYFMNRRVLKLWQTATHESYHRRIREVQRTVTRKRKRKIAAWYFGCWRDKMFRIMDGKIDAEDFVDERRRDLAVTTLINWRTRTKEAVQDYAEANAHYELSLLRMTFNLWKERREHLQELQLDAEDALYNHNLKLMRLYSRKWDTRRFDLSMLSEKGNRYFERNEASRAATLFHLWKFRLQQHRQERLDNEAELQKFEAFADTTIIPLRNGAVTPPKAARTPVWRTTGRGRRLLLGNKLLIGSTPLGSPGSPLKRYGLFGRSTIGSTLGRVVEPDDEDDGTLIGSGSGPGSRSTRGLV